MSNKTKTIKDNLAFSLIELLIVVVVLLVVLSAVLLFLLRGTESFHFARMQNELTTAGRVALAEMKNSIIWAGYMPQGGWDENDWHPLVAAETDNMEFYADWEPLKSLDSTDYRIIELLDDGYIQIRDREDYVKITGDAYITQLKFTYLDENGSDLGAYDLSNQAYRDQIRHIQIEITLTAQSSDDIYQTVMQTTVSPRNLGINHNINPGFYGPPEREGYIVFNVAGDDSVPDASPDEQAMIDRLSFWGYTTTQLTDAMLTTYDYDDITLLILRHVTNGTHGNSSFFQNLSVPIITMNGEEAAEVFNMGSSYETIAMNTMVVEEPAHPLNRDLPSTFSVYADSGYHSILYGFEAEVSLLTKLEVGSDSSGVSVINDGIPSLRRIHFSPWQATQFTENGGWVLFRNAVEWISYSPEEDPGVPLTEMETFDVLSTEEQLITLWGDSIIPSTTTDTTTVYFEDFESKLNPSWQYTPSPTYGRCDVITEGGMTFLRMDRDGFGSSVQNSAIWNLNLSDYDESTDDIILQMDTKAGEFETSQDLDGIFLNAQSTSTDTLFSIDFEPVYGSRTPGEIHYSGTGGIRVHSPLNWQGDGSFVTMDALTQGLYAYNRVMIEASTARYNDGDVLTLSYRFHDHNDDNHDSGAQSDFVGWNSTGDIDGDFTLIEYLNPTYYSDYSWHERSVSFTPESMPDSIYIIFGQYGNYQADLFSAADGISLDNILLTGTRNDSLYINVAQPPSSGQNWNTTTLDLDNILRSNGLTFNSSFEVMLSQYDQGNWSNYGMGWDNIEIAVLTDENTAEGWEHGSLHSNKIGYTGEDDWRIGNTGDNYYWEIQNETGGFSDSSYCYLQTPSIYIPLNSITTFLHFKHMYNTLSNNAGGYVQISMNNGTTWDNLPLSYIGSCGASHPAPTETDIFWGSNSRVNWTAASADLAAFAGNSVILRFVFGAASAQTEGYWKIDDLSIEATVNSYSVNSLIFDVGSENPDWNYENIDVYLSTIPDDSVFSGSGEWSKSTMTLVADDISLQVQDSGWQTIMLDNTFYLPEGHQLAVKVEKADTTTTADSLGWEHVQTSDYLCRRGSGDTEPENLTASNYLPLLKIGTTTAEILCDIPYTPTHSQSESPLNNTEMFSDFEGIYSFTSAGSGSAIEWTHSGTNNDWEFGVPGFVPDIDPWLVPENGGSIAGTDLTTDGYYDNNAWAYLISPPYEMPAVQQSSVILRFDRCIRMAPTDDALIHIGFSADEDYPTQEEDWMLVKSYSTNHSYWDTEDIHIESFMSEGDDDGAEYFFIRYVLTSGSQGVRGGWNLDNVQIFGDAE